MDYKVSLREIERVVRGKLEMQGVRETEESFLSRGCRQFEPNHINLCDCFFSLMCVLVCFHSRLRDMI